MQLEDRLLVVGTTSDYIDWIRRICPERAVFITDPVIRSKAREPAPKTHEEVLCDLADNEHVRHAVTDHVKQWGFRVQGVACFDCESMALAALLAEDFSVAYPSLSAVNNCRDKFVSKLIWQKNGIGCPRVVPVRRVEDALGFFSTLEADCILKPLSGSGSELIFRCRTEEECRQAFASIEDGLRQREGHRLYKTLFQESPPIIAEEFVDAPEFSCDFLIEDGEVTLIRLSRKIPSPHGPFGTTMGYELIDTLPQGVDLGEFCRSLGQSAAVLGISGGICMVDFLVHRGKIILLEMTPRPGGDCLPALLRSALQLDILALTLDVAEKRPFRLGSFRPSLPVVALRIHARQGGVFRRIRWGTVEGDPRIREICVTRHPGDVIRMPPEDYDSFVLGYIIFTPRNGIDIMTECTRLTEGVAVDIESP